MPSLRVPRTAARRAACSLQPTGCLSPRGAVPAGISPGSSQQAPAVLRAPLLVSLLPAARSAPRQQRSRARPVRPDTGPEAGPAGRRPLGAGAGPGPAGEVPAFREAPGRAVPARALTCCLRGPMARPPRPHLLPAPGPPRPRGGGGGAPGPGRQRHLKARARGAGPEPP